MSQTDLDVWLKQTDEPLFPDTLWAKPERKNQAGKLLIIGGHLHGFEQAATAYENSTLAGIGQVKVTLPDKLKPLLGSSLEGAVFSASTNSGTLAQASLSELKSYATWADGVLLLQPGENSETTLLLTRFIKEVDKPLIIAEDVMTQIQHDFKQLIPASTSWLILTVNGLQTVMKLLGSQRAIRHDMGLRPLVVATTSEPLLSPYNILCIYEDNVVVLSGGLAITTRRSPEPQLAALAAWAATWWIQQPTKPLEAIATAVFEF